MQLLRFYYHCLMQCHHLQPHLQYYHHHHYQNHHHHQMEHNLDQNSQIFDVFRHLNLIFLSLNNITHKKNDKTIVYI
jgi:hypothetical protein